MLRSDFKDTRKLEIILLPVWLDRVSVALVVENIKKLAKEERFRLIVLV
jgi:hypothetical protein